MTDTACSPRTLALLKERARSSEPAQRVWAAKHKHLPEHLLEELAGDVSWDVARAALLNPRLPHHTMRTHMFKRRNMMVWGNKALPEPLVLEVLAKLSAINVHDSNLHQALYLLLPNPACPESVMRFYAKHSSEYYRMYVARNPNLPLDVMQELAHDRRAHVAAEIAKNKRVTPEIIVSMASDTRAVVLRSVLRSPYAPEGLAEQHQSSDAVTLRRAALRRTKDVDALYAAAFGNDHTMFEAVADNVDAPDEVKVAVALRRR